MGSMFKNFRNFLVYLDFSVFLPCRYDVTGTYLHFCHLCHGLERSYMRKRMLKWIVSCLRLKAI